MKHLGKIIFILLIYCMYGCESSNKNKFCIDGKHTEYYSSGVVKIEAECQDSILNGLCKGYYENGNLQFQGRYKSGNFDSCLIEYYPNKNVRTKANYIKGKPYGAYLVFYEDKPYAIHKKILFVDNLGEHVKVSYQEFNKEGELIFDSSQVKITGVKKYYKYYDTVKVHFRLTNPVFDRYELNVGNFDDRLRLIDSTNYFMKDGKGHEGDFYVIAKTKGLNILRGYVKDYKIEKKYSDSTYSTLAIVSSYFEVEYQVSSK